MTKEQFRKRLAQGKMILDGATGSNLQERGLPAGVCPEEWILENPDVLKELQSIMRQGLMQCMHPLFPGTELS